MWTFDCILHGVLWGSPTTTESLVRTAVSQTPPSFRFGGLRISVPCDLNPDKPENMAGGINLYFIHSEVQKTCQMFDFGIMPIFNALLPEGPQITGSMQKCTADETFTVFCRNFFLGYFADIYLS